MSKLELDSELNWLERRKVRMLVSFIWADYAEAWATGFQDPASDWKYAIIDLHDRIVFYLLII